MRNESPAFSDRAARVAARLGVLIILGGIGCNDTDQPASPLLPLSPAALHDVGADSPAIILRGTVILPDRVIKHGYVAIDHGRIISVSEKQPKIPDALTINARGIIAPGFVDVHNHIVWNALPRWIPSRTFANRDEWAHDPEAQAHLAPIDILENSQLCDLNAWGELRAVAGGTTSILGTHPAPCIHGLVRNLDYNSEFYGTTQLNREHIFNNVLFPPPSPPAARAQFVAVATSLIASPFYEALVVHAAEGTDAFAEEQFTFLRSANLLNPKGVIVHGVSLTQADFAAMAASGTALVWSPRSNLELYGHTTNVLAALGAGVEVALAPDWAVTGSSNTLEELKIASRWNRDCLGGALSDRQLVDMTTSVAAHIVGIDDEVGAIRAGLRADLVVIDGDHNDPLRAIIDSDESAVELVLIGGVAVYGDRSVLEQFWEASDLEDITLIGNKKALAVPASGFRVSDLAARLTASLAAQGTFLAPLIESEPTGHSRSFC